MFTPSAFSGQATFYSGGLGACGTIIAPTDYAIAVSPEFFNTTPNVCGKTVVITYQDKSVTATILDEFPGARGAYDIDVTRAVFSALASLDHGIIDVTWTV